MRTACIIICLLLWAAAGRADEPAYTRHLDALTRTPHRQAGSPEGRAAADYIEQELTALGVGTVVAQDFPTVRLVSEQSELVIGDRTLPLAPLRPNGLQPSITSATGLVAPLIDMRGDRDADGIDFTGAIVLVDYMRADVMADFFRLRASALIIVGQPGDDGRYDADKRSFVSADLPRFYVDAAAADAFGLGDAAEARLTATARWERAVGRNVYLWLPGTPREADKPAEYAILSAYYDTAGIVPSRAPGRAGAANAAALLDAAAALAAQPAGRPVLIAFFDAHANFIEGGRQFYSAIRRSVADRLEDPWPVRLTYLTEEEAYITSMLDYLAAEDIIESTHPMRSRGLDLLSTEAHFEYNERQRPLTEIRFAISDALKADPEANVEALDQELAAAIADHRAWQLVRESLRDRVTVAQALSQHEEWQADAAPMLQRADAAYAEMLARVTTRLVDRQRELGDARHYIEEAQAIGELLAGHTPILHASYSFSSGHDQWLFHCDSARFGRLWDAFATTLADDPSFIADAWQKPLPYLDRVVIEEADLADVFEIPGVTLATASARDLARQTPMETLTADGAATIRQQADSFLLGLRRHLDSSAASVPDRMTNQSRLILDNYRWTDKGARGHAARSFAYGQTAPERVEPGAVVQLMSGHRATSPAQSPTGQGEYLVIADGNGIFPFEALLDSPRYSGYWRRALISAGQFDADGRLRLISACIPSGGRGSVQSGWAAAGWYAPQANTDFEIVLALFAGEPGIVVGTRDATSDPYRESSFRILNALNHSTYKHQSFRFDAETGIGAYSIEAPMGIKLIHGGSPFIGATDAKPRGIGFGPGSATDVGTEDLSTTLGPDLHRLNESRLATFRERNIIMNRYEHEHSRAGQWLTTFDEAEATHDHSAAVAAARQIALAEGSIYQPIIDITNDMVVAITILLLLAIPFAFSIQALLLPSYSIYRQLGTFAAIFFIVFLLLYVVHPAFAFAQTPVIIILAFIILVMSGMVIWLITQKFRYEIKKMQGLANAAHNMRSSVVGNFGSGVALAIATMRRRPVRTGLTIVTVLLLTFTVLSFVSFQSELGVSKFHRGSADTTSRLLIHRRIWATQPTDSVQDVQGMLGDRFQVHGRYWLTQELSLKMTEDFFLPVFAGAHHGKATAAMTLDPLELARIPEFARILGPVDPAFHSGEGLYLADRLAEELQAKVGDTVRLRGLSFRVLGLFAPAAVSEIRQIDGSPLLPVNFSQTQAQLGGGTDTGRLGTAEEDLQAALAQLEPDALEPVDAAGLIIVSTARARDLGMALKAVVAYPEDPADTVPAAYDLTLYNEFGIYANDAGHVQYLSYGEQLGAAGFRDVLLPLALGALIVFSTMLGSVIDREREIYTFSALGLAPRTIAALFFIEAGIYAVIGGFGGYVFSQVIAVGLEWAARFGWFAAPEMNYSSSTAIRTILLVMATVMISTIYPAMRAAAKATADAASRWSIPPAAGDVLAFDFPFTISRHDISGIMCFLSEHFECFADRSVGHFAIADLARYRDTEHGMMALQATIWLAPFDQGISQSLTLVARPSDIEEVCEIHVTLVRGSGSPAAWERSNRVFLNDLRSQFLLWRTLEDDALDHYLDEADDEDKRLDIVLSHLT